MRLLRPFPALLALVFAFTWMSLSSPGSAAPAYEPPRGSQERRDILNALRPLVEARLNPPVEFVVNYMQVSSGWAFLHVSPQRPGGAQIDLRTTTFSEDADYMDGAETYALLRYQYDRWNIVDYAIGPTDVFWQGDPLYQTLPAGVAPR
ncbi:hypothetical protein JM93_01409 [Roseibium hamelinense]|uniref:Uncharacterized protein n=1 Tax=Roseibium hamelinense TaxID=150831 RepID=A0A562TAY7_9HYPH|nr:hypothetical protein [Roseibium hamelinense]TWI90428.1 hypothetical protein JM93_01409 [Roseibium hamelinense]